MEGPAWLGGAAAGCGDIGTGSMSRSCSNSLLQLHRRQTGSRGLAWFDQDLKALVGRMILHAFDDDKLGLHKWYMGKVRFFGVSAADKREVPTASERREGSPSQNTVKRRQG